MTPARTISICLTVVTMIGTAAMSAHAADRPVGIDKIKHFLVIYLENRSFDNLYGNFPGASGIANAGATLTQVDKDGKPYAVLPPVINASAHPNVVDERFPNELQNGKTFEIDKYVPIDKETGDLVHRFYQEQAQIDGGKMDKFVAYSDAASLVMGTYDISKTALWRYAKEYTLADNFFHAAFGGSFLNHFWLICECTPTFPKAPDGMRAKLDDKGEMLKDGAVSPDGYVINTAFTVFKPHPAKVKREFLMPAQKGMTIGDQLTKKGISWAWYSGGWNDAVAGKPDKLFQFHHQALAFFKQFGDKTAARKRHLRDEKDMLAEIRRGRLPAVAFWKPIGAENQHPGYAELVKGDRKVEEVIEAVRNGPLWKNTLIVVTYDENGGFWDHVAPPKIDKWGPGSRVPAIIISPFAKRGYVDHTLYDTTSILKLIHERYKLPALSSREAAVGDLSDALQF